MPSLRLLQYTSVASGTGPLINFVLNFPMVFTPRCSVPNSGQNQYDNRISMDDYSKEYDVVRRSNTKQFHRWKYDVVE